ncbi:MAG: hypothetical protein ACJAZO_003987 [Myxococcota bacterium]|jgi:hypothetical protein
MRWLFFASLCRLSVALASPACLTHSGRLFDTSGAPIDGSRTLTFELLDSSNGDIVGFA